MRKFKKKEDLFSSEVEPHDLDTFDRSILFSCFRTWVESIRMQSKSDPQKALDCFLVLADYCLYGKEPAADANPWGAAWPIVQHEADLSIKNRSRRFGHEDIDLHDKIKKIYLENPRLSQRAIAACAGCSLGTVNKVLKRLANTGGSGVCSIDYISVSASDIAPRGDNVEQDPFMMEEHVAENITAIERPAQSGEMES